MRGRLVAAFVLLALVPLLVHIAVNSRNTRGFLVADPNQSLLASAVETANSIDSFIDNNLDAIQAEAQFPALALYLFLHDEGRADSSEALTTGISKYAQPERPLYFIVCPFGCAWDRPFRHRTSRDRAG
jgi:hypothetical protein